MLELGCATGSNLIPMAYGLPRAEFVGLDLSIRQITEGRQFIADVGLPNIQLTHGDLRAFDANLGRFDYIIVHGVHSWAPRDVQHAILRICGQLLTERGVALVSYNAYPGCHLRQMIRGMAQFHVRDIEDLDERADQLHALVRFLVDSLGDENKVYRQVLASEASRLGELSGAFVLHDVLEDDNYPVYFHEFIAQAAEHGLQYLGEAIPLKRLRTGQTAAQLAALRTKFDLIEYEQHLDFLEGTAFRRTLICRQQHSLHHDPQRADWDQLLLASQTAPASTAGAADLHGDQPLEFTVRKGKLSAAVRCDRPIEKAAMLLLGESYPRALPFGELLAKSAARLARPATADDAAEIRDVVLGGLPIGATEVHCWQPNFAMQPSEFPEASLVARCQLANGWEATTLWHDRLTTTEPVDRQLLMCLDGRHDRAAILNQILNEIGRRTAISGSGQNLTAANEPTRASLAARLETALAELARAGLLIA